MSLKLMIKYSISAIGKGQSALKVLVSGTSLSNSVDLNFFATDFKNDKSVSAIYFQRLKCLVAGWTNFMDAICSVLEKQFFSACFQMIFCHLLKIKVDVDM